MKKIVKSLIIIAILFFIFKVGFNAGKTDGKSHEKIEQIEKK